MDSTIFSATFIQQLTVALIGQLSVLIPIAFGLYFLHQELAARRIEREENRKERQARSDWLKRERHETARLSDLIAHQVAEQLRRDPSWAETALQAAKLGPYIQGVFAERLNHFRAEKEALSKAFTPLLLDHCMSFIKEGRHVFLVIDSGTTLFPFFEKLARAAAEYLARSELSLTDKLTIVTNSLSGVDSLMRFGGEIASDVHSGLELKCRVLPGTPLPVYSALTGPETIESLRRVHLNAPDDSMFIGLTTGNWVRISDSGKPLPLARGPGHLDFKRCLIEECQEIFVVSPLGKVFVNATLESINKALGLSYGAPTEDSKPYEEPAIELSKEQSIRLVSTTRISTRALHVHGELVRGALKPKPGPPADDGHLLISFNALPTRRELELITEFPHSVTRTEEILKEFFQVEVGSDGG